MTPPATTTLEVDVALAATITHTARADGQVSITATITATVAGAEHHVGRAGGVTAPAHADDIDTELRHHCTALGIPVTPAEGRLCLARDAAAVTGAWDEWQVLVPGAMVGGDLEAPEFADTWMPVAEVKTDDGQVVFAIAADGPGRVVVAAADTVQVREGW